MLRLLTIDFDAKTVQSQQTRANLTWGSWFLLILGLSGILSLLVLRSGPNTSLIAFLIYIVGAVVILYEPRFGIYLTLTLALMGDSILMPAYPFVKNFSSAESLLYLNDAIIISPLETYLVLIFISWLGRLAMKRNLSFYVGQLFWPTMAFFAFILFGFFYGLSVGGDLNIALWESRPIFYLPVMLVLVSNLITERKHINNLIWAIMLGLFIEGLSGLYYIFVKLSVPLSQVNEITEHGAAIHMNTVFVLVVAVWIYKGSLTKRILIPLMSLPVVLTYIATQRRAAFLTLAIAFMLMIVVLYKENRRAFWLIIPPMAFLGLFYIGIFWNVDSAIGLPAQAIKAALFPSQASAADASSDLYRVLENINSNFTIHIKPLTGVGFGNKFYKIVALPDISFFTFYEYITHNSIMWIWMKAGVGGFLTMIFLIGYTIMVGVRVLWRMPGGDLSAIALMAMLYIIMHFLYAYVDMSWDIQSMLYIGAMVGILNNFEYVVSKSVPLPNKRWPWQPNPVPEPTILPLFGKDKKSQIKRS